MAWTRLYPTHHCILENPLTALPQVLKPRAGKLGLGQVFALCLCLIELTG
jgi:hypothetical protein